MHSLSLLQLFNKKPSSRRDQDVAVDLAQPLPSPNSSPDPPHHYFYSATPVNNSRKSSASAVYISQPISLESVRMNLTTSPVELDLSHLNREEQEHIANVLKRARAVEEQQQQSVLPAVTVPPRLSSSTTFSSSSSTTSLTDEQAEKLSDEMLNQTEKLIFSPECQIDQQANSTASFPSPNNEFSPGEIENHSNQNNGTCSTPHSIAINRTRTSPLANHLEEEKDNLIAANSIALERNESNCSAKPFPSSRTEIDENEFLYEEPSPYETVLNTNMKSEARTSTYQIEELNDDDDDDDERDHVKELEETIANLSRHFPSEQSIESDSILEMEIESPTTDDQPSSPPVAHPPSLCISIPISTNTRRTSLSRSSGIKEHLTDLLGGSHAPLQRTLSTHTNRVSSINRHKRNLPSVPSERQIRRTNSESRFTLPAVRFNHQLDDESDLIEIDLNDPIGSMNRTLKTSTTEEVNFHPDLPPKPKQSRDQTTNTPPMESFNASIKSKKKLKKKSSSSSTGIISKLQKSTSTEITYPFPVSKLLLNPSRHGIGTALGFRITGGYSSALCTEVTASIVEIDANHRNYQILKNVVGEGDEVLELGGVSLRGKSALFVENLVNRIENEFEILVRKNSGRSPSISSLHEVEQTTPQGASHGNDNSNDSDESDSLSQYFDSRTSSSVIAPHGRSQSVIPLQNFLKSDVKRMARNSTSIERKSSLSFASLKFLRKKTKSVDFTHQQTLLLNQFRENNFAGEIEIQISHSTDHEQLVLRIIQARHLRSKDANGYSDPFVKIYLLPGREQENKRRIKHVTKTLNPRWNQTVIYGHVHREELQYKKLEVTVWDYDRFKANDFLGQVIIDLKNPNVIDDKPHWYRLQSLRSREEMTNRSSSPGLFKVNSLDSAASLAIKKNLVQIPAKSNQSK